MGKTTFTGVGDRALACLAWTLRAVSVALAVLIPALAWPHAQPWLAASATGLCVGGCQGLLLLVERARKIRAAGVASEATCAALQARINDDLAAILGAVSRPLSPGGPPLTETIQRRIRGISGQLRDGCGGFGPAGVKGMAKPSANPLALQGQPGLGTTRGLDVSAAVAEPGNL